MSSVCTHLFCQKCKGLISFINAKKTFMKIKKYGANCCPSRKGETSWETALRYLVSTKQKPLRTTKLCNLGVQTCLLFHRYKGASFGLDPKLRVQTCLLFHRYKGSHLLARLWFWLKHIYFHIGTKDDTASTLYYYGFGPIYFHTGTRDLGCKFVEIQ